MPEHKKPGRLFRARTRILTFACTVIFSLSLIYIVAAPRTSHASILDDITTSVANLFGQSSSTESALPAPAISPVPISTPSAAQSSNDQVEALTGQIRAFNANLTKTKTAYDNAVTAKDRTANNQNLLNIVNQRKGVIKQLMQTSPGFFDLLAMSSTQRSSLPALAQVNVEQSTTVTGTISVIHHDPPEGQGDDYFTYTITTPTASYNFYPTSDVTILSGATVEVTGYLLDNQISANTDRNPVRIINRVIKKAINPTPSSVGNQKTLVLLLTDAASSPVPFDTTTAHNLVFNGEMQKFYNEQSYGQVSFSGDVYGWVVYPQESMAGGCMYVDPNTLGTIVNQYKINLSNYTRIVYLAKDGDAGGCSEVGASDHSINGQTYDFSQSYVGLDEYNSPIGSTPLPWTLFAELLSHELGHALGTMHANAWDCGDQIDTGDCSHVEYGNPFDVMGTGTFSLEFNAFYKDYLGWFPPNRILSITKSGTYTINPLELQSGVTAAKVTILGSNTTPYYIEFRQPIDFDSNLSNPSFAENNKGILINKIVTNQGDPFPRLLNMHPSSSLDYFENAANIDQASFSMSFSPTSPQVFNDPADGIVIGPVTQVSTSSVTFNVSLTQPTCVRQDPTFDAFDSAGQRTDIDTLPVPSGGSKNINLTIINSDYFACGSSSFHVSLVLPQGWTSTIPADITLGPGQDAIDYLSINPVGNAGTYPVEIDLNNTQSGLKTAYKGSITINTPMTITGINPSSGPSGTQLVISGKSFGSNCSNSILMLGIHGSSQTDSSCVNSTDGTLNFTVPSTLSYCSPICTSTTTFPGAYTLTIFANGTSASTTFQVVSSSTSPVSASSTAAIVGSSTLALQYDPSGNEASLVSTFDVRVTAGSQDEKIAKTYAFQSYVTTNNGVTTGGAETYAEPAGVTDDGNGFYVVPAGTSVDFIVQNTYDPKTMFAGAYHSVLSMVFLGDFLTGPAQYYNMPPPNTTNTVVVVGETSPYINSVVPNAVPSNQQLTITGVRLSKSAKEQVNLSNWATTTVYYLQGTPDGSGTRLRLVPNTPPGAYTLQVIDPVTGASNQASVTLTKPIQVSPSPSPSLSTSVNPASVSTTSVSNGVTTSAASIAPVASAPAVASTCYTFNTYLTLGSTGPDVTALQNFLVANHFLVLPQIASTAGYFGSVTQTALMKYQGSVGIAETGTLGPITRTYINDTCEGIALPQSSPSPSPSPSYSPSPSPVYTPVSSPSYSPIPTQTVYPTYSPIPSYSPSHSPSPSPSYAPTYSPVPVQSTPVVSTEPSVAPSSAPISSPVQSTTPVPSSTPAPNVSPSTSPAASPSPSVSTKSSASPTISPKPSSSSSPSPSPSGVSFNEDSQSDNLANVFVATDDFIDGIMAKLFLFGGK